MRVNVTLTWSRIIYGLMGLILLGLAGALLVAWSGIYSVAASRGHPGWLNWFLELGMRRSVEANAKQLQAPDLTDASLITLGASHFQGGCAPCHGGPGEPVNPIYQAMLPVPPKLDEHADSWSANELHWIVKHGLQYAGMPGWAATERDDEIWAMVAFLRALPELDEETYLELASGNAPVAHPSGAELIANGSSASSLATCSKCHDTASNPPASNHVPRLGGQSEAYLRRALADYRANRRQSGFMEPVASEISEKQMEEIAALFARLDSPGYADNSLPDADLEAGQQIALEGVPARRVAACQACHDADAKPEYPRLAGQSAIYLRNQLKLWRDAPPSDTAYAELMRHATGWITDAQIRDVAAWYASQPTGASAPEPELQTSEQGE